MEVLTSRESKHEFPNHFHERYTVSIIEQGVFGENQYIATEGSVVISHPFEMHENKLVDDNTYSFTTYYVNPDVMKFISKNRDLYFQEKVIKDPFLFSQLKQISTTIGQPKNGQPIAQKIIETLTYLEINYGGTKPLRDKINPNFINEVQTYILRNLHSKMELITLANLVNLDKYQFIRKFKGHLGITPFEYISLQRISRAKQLLTKGKPIIDVALETGFYDQSHLCKYFKRYVGISPKNYLEARNMFLDLPLSKA